MIYSKILHSGVARVLWARCGDRFGVPSNRSLQIMPFIIELTRSLNIFRKRFTFGQNIRNIVPVKIHTGSHL